MRPRMRRFASYLFFLVFLAITAWAQQDVAPLPQDTGSAGLQQAIQYLRNTGRMLHTTAHPDDEDGGMLTLMSRGEGAHVTLLTLTRGEGGQNRTGSGLFDELGVLRTLELLAADRYYGVEQRFTRVADFGFSKSASETFAKWRGHDVALGDMVRVIRTFRPDVIVSRFEGTARDGHGHHQATGILTKEAFHAAADPNRFPEQIEEGLLPWQAKKLYLGNVRDAEDYSVILETTQQSPLLGMSYQAFAMQGLKHQLSQGAGQWSLPTGKRYSRYKLVDSVLPNTLGPDGHESGFFDGIDTSIAGLAKRLGVESRRTPDLPGKFGELQSKLDEAAEAAKKDPRSAAKPLSESLQVLETIEGEMAHAGVKRVAQNDVLAHLPRHREIEHAIALAEDVTVESRLVQKPEPSGQLVVPGESFTVAVTIKGPAGVKLTHASVAAPDGWTIKALPPDASKPLVQSFEVRVPDQAEYTRPYYHRENPETDAIYSIDDPEYLTLPVAPPPLTAEAEYDVNGISGRVQGSVKAEDEIDGATRAVPLAVVPPASVLFNHASRVMRVDQHDPVEVTVQVRSDVAELKGGSLSLMPATGWRVEPVAQPVELKGKGAERQFKFYLFPDAMGEMRFDMRAKLTLGRQDYLVGFSTVTRPDLGTAYHYQPALQHVSVVNVNLPDNYVAGYIMGAGDEIPTYLRELGLNIKTISAEELATGNLNARYNAIALGIRAYDVNEEVRKYNSRLLEFVNRGGTLLVQYNAAVAEFNAGHYTPYPAELGRDRVSVEDAPVEMLEPKDFIFNEPNEITPHDFDGWVQERGLNFMKSWGGKFVPLLQSNDPSEAPLEGGLLRAWYGKGTYVYTGYAFFRQVPYGVPGALRLFINLLSARQ